MKRAEQLQPPVAEPVRVVACVDRVEDPELAYVLAAWVQKLLKAEGTPDQGR